MSTEENKTLANQVWEEIWHQGLLSRIDELFTPDFLRHDPRGRELHGTEQNRQFISSIRAAFPDVHYTVDDQIAEGNKVVACYRFQGTHLGEFQG
jgi:predicted ester cyclase